MPTSPNPPMTDAERQALRRQRRKEEIKDLRFALYRIAQTSSDAKAREIAMKALVKDAPD